MSNYNISNLTSSNNVLEFGQAVNGLTGDAFFVLVTAMIFIISFVAMKGFDTRTAFMSASFITTIGSVMLWAGGLLSEAALIVVFSLLLISVFLKAIE